MRSRWMVASMLLVASATVAQARAMVPELRPIVGAFIPIKEEKADLGSSMLFGVQSAMEIGHQVHLVGTFAWSPSEMRPTSDKVNIYQYDGGIEGFSTIDLNDRWTLHPFGGVGFGGRTFDFVGSGSSNDNFVGYGAVGTELQNRRLGFRLEGRFYFDHDGPHQRGAASATHRDWMVLGGAALHLW